MKSILPHALLCSSSCYFFNIFSHYYHSYPSHSCNNLIEILCPYLFHIFFFIISDRTLYQIRAEPSSHEREHAIHFNRAPSKRQKVVSRKSRVRKPPKIAEEVKEKPEIKEPEVIEPSDEKAVVQFEEIELDQPYDPAYVSYFYLIKMLLK